MIVAIILNLIIAGIAGWLAGKIMHYNKSTIGNICMGILGGFVGSAVLGIFGLAGSGIIGSIIVSIIGACIVIWLARVLFK